MNQYQFLEAELLQIFPDELLHSYVLRVIISQGLANRPSDIKGVISSASLIRADLELTEQQSRIFSIFPVTALMELLENHMPVKGYPRLSNPKSLAAKCGRIFFHRRTGVIEDFTLGALGNPKEIYYLKYCPECIREQIQLYGSGWFKFDWLFSRNCDVHNLNFILVNQQICLCKLNILDNLISALSGVCVRCKAEVKFPPKITEPIGGHFSPLIDLSPSIQKRYRENRDFPISFCFIRAFERWAREFCHRLYDDNGRFASFDLLILRNLEKLIDVNGNDKDAKIGDLMKLLDQFERYLNDDFCDFLDRHTEILKVDCSDCVPAQIFVGFKVAKDRDCATCNVRSGLCPFKT